MHEDNTNKRDQVCPQIEAFASKTRQQEGTHSTVVKKKNQKISTGGPDRAVGPHQLAPHLPSLLNHWMYSCPPWFCRRCRPLRQPCLRPCWSMLLPREAAPHHPARHRIDECQLPSCMHRDRRGCAQKQHTARTKIVQLNVGFMNNVGQV